eukprot:1551780-Karenia_brevis.AAC.1
MALAAAGDDVELPGFRWCYKGDRRASHHDEQLQPLGPIVLCQGSQALTDGRATVDGPAPCTDGFATNNEAPAAQPLK